jgi:enhancing lycopene biosynthesis protein 2
MKRVGVVLSGCGVYDGAEIHEAVFTMLALDEAGAEYTFLAPNVEQMHVVDHARGDVTGERRNVLVESARIARGKVRDLAGASADDFDALVFPGGFGAAKNLCDFAVKGADCAPNAAVAKLVAAMYQAGKPLGFACIAPALAAAIFRDAGVPGVKLTIGDDEDTAAALRKMGAEHVALPVEEALVDAAHRVVSTPAYMYGEARPHLVRAGLKKMVEAVLALT